MPLGAFKAAIMGVAGVSTGDVVLLSSQTADGDDELDFSSGITSTYGEYIFKFYNINAATDATDFTFQVNADGESGYNETITSTAFRARHYEDDSVGELGIETAQDQAQGTAYQVLLQGMNSDADGSCAGVLHVFNPSSTTYVTHWYSRVQAMSDEPASREMYMAGYINTTAAITDISFKMASGNFDGKIKMWGVL